MVPHVRGWIGCAVALALIAPTAQAGVEPVVELRAATIAIDDSALGARSSVELELPLVVLAGGAPKPAAGNVAAVAPAVGPAARTEPGAVLDGIEARLGFAALGHAVLPGAPFVPRLATGADGHRHLVLGFDAATVARPGNYAVAIDLVRAGSGDVVQTLAVTLERPAAALRATPSAIVIEPCQWLPHEVTTLDPPVPVALEEISRATRAAVAIDDTRMAEAAGRRIPAGMALGGGIVVVEAGTIQRLMLGLTGPFPPGTTTGAIELRSAQAPWVRVPYVLRTRIAWPALAGFVVVGWIAGLGLRAALRWYLARQHALDQIAEVERDARALGLAIADPKLGTAAVIAACNEARKDWRAADAAVAKLRARLEDVKARFQPVLDGARARLASFARAVGPDWRLPADVAGALGALRRTAADATAELAVRNASAVNRLLDEAFGDRMATLIKRVDAWRASSVTTAAMLEAAPALSPWPSAVAPMANEAAATWRVLVMGVPTDRPSDSDAVMALLRAVHAVEVHLAAAALQLITSWRIVLDACANELAELPGKPLAALSAKLPEASNGEIALAKLTAAAQPIAEELAAALLELGGGNEVHRKQLEIWLADGKWVNAASLVRRLTTASELAVARTHSVRLEPSGMRATSTIAMAIESIPPALPKTDAIAAGRAARAIELAALRPTAIVSAGLLLVYYVVHVSTVRIATWPDLAGVAVQAGAIDLGLAALATAAKHIAR